MNLNKKILFWRIIFLITSIFSIACMIQIVGVAKAYQIDILHSMWIFLISVIGVVIAAGITVFLILFTPVKVHVIELPEKIMEFPNGWRIPAICLFIVILPVYSLITLNPYLGRYYAAGQWTHLALFWWIAIFGMVCLKSFKKNISWTSALWVGALIMAVIAASVRLFITVTNFPFALSWSEAARFYGASLLFSKQIYGMKVPLGILHPTWHFLLAVPFALGKLPIWAHRLWWAILQIGLGISVSWVVAKRFTAGKRALTWIAAGWVFIFLVPRPILVHLLFCTLIVVWGVRTNRFWWTTIIVIASSIWAGLSRINWFPVPGIIAAVLYLIEIQIRKSEELLAYLWKPVLWVLGGSAIAYVSNLVYISLTGNGVGGNFISSLNSALLWYRLLPNPTSQQGILLDLVILAGPLILALIICGKFWIHSLHPLRLAGIFTSLGVLLAGGLIVSVKIGGGSDLHNLDAFLILLTLVAGYFLFDNYHPDKPFDKPAILRKAWLTALILFTPVWMILRMNSTMFVWDIPKTEQTLQLIKNTVEGISNQDGEILFISQRQLLALQMIKAKLVPDYEQDFLMEMVMSHNQSYLDQFHQDLRTQKFNAIVLDAQNVHQYGSSRAYGEENDLWVLEVTNPLLCYYEVPPAFSALSIVVYTPRSQPCK
jgi:hypothetical protein